MLSESTGNESNDKGETCKQSHSCTKHFTLTSPMLTESTGTKRNFQVSQIRKLKLANNHTRCFLPDFWSFLAYFRHVFGCSCWGGFAPPDLPALALVFVVRGEVFSQLCQGNPRTCRGQSRESKNLPRTKPRRKSVRTPSGKLKSPSFLLPSSLLYRNPPYSKNFGRRYSPPGGLQLNNDLHFQMDCLNLKYNCFHREV